MSRLQEYRKSLVENWLRFLEVEVDVVPDDGKPPLPMEYEANGFNHGLLSKLSSTSQADIQSTGLSKEEYIERHVRDFDASMPNMLSERLSNLKISRDDSENDWWSVGVNSDGISLSMESDLDPSESWEYGNIKDRLLLPEESAFLDPSSAKDTSEAISYSACFPSLPESYTPWNRSVVVSSTFHHSRFASHEDKNLKSANGGLGRSDQRMLVCPYTRYDPEKYEKLKSCRGKAFETVHRLKEHLYRIHMRKPYCCRCGERFAADQELNLHLSLPSDACGRVENVETEGFGPEQTLQLKSRKRKLNVKTQEEKWRNVFQILFPDAAEVPNPFYHAVGQEQIASRSDTEAVYNTDIPQQLEDKTFSKVDAIVRELGMDKPLNKKQRRHMLEVFKEFHEERTE
ncbi:hypothetical protein GQ607_011111 [Colletotrichum asianum]|uniref:C2H2-type domain-containing protein n=1 Tax=Colletotrichum asianum TaxID=702518 RepID=A0A8H3W5F5_9PEZI|nr:hypothetical protein GQ607_011111 [Colletotrichum asianum]